MASAFKSQNSGSGDEINLIKVLNQYRKRWYLLVIVIGISLIGCKLYLRYATPSYMAAATIRIEEERNSAQGLGLLESLGNFTSNIQSEIRMLRSRSMIEKALKEMNYMASYFLVGNLVTAEMHKEDTPFIVAYDTLDNSVMYNRTFSMSFLGGNKFRLTSEEANVGDGVRYFGEAIDVDGFKFKIYKRETVRYKLIPGIEYKWKAITWKSLRGRASAGLRVEQTGHLVPILKITSQDHVPKFTADFINTLLLVYQDQDIDKRAQAANQQLAFIQSQVDTIKAAVESAEKILQDFQKKEEFFGVEQRLNLNMEKIRSAEAKLVEEELKLMQITRLEEEMKGEPKSLTLPFSLENLSDPTLLSAVASYNEIVNDKITGLQSFQPSHPKIQELDLKLAEFRSSILGNITSLKNQIEKNKAFFEKGLQLSKGDLSELPETQRLYLSLNREYEVQERILSTLLEKQAEAQIARASIVSPVQVVDGAIPPSDPISPNSRNVYIVGVGFGACIGILFILVTGMLNTTLSYREEIENISMTPIIGSVRKSDKSVNQKYPKLIVTNHPKSSLSESIRGIRTNLQFISPGKKTKIVAITSTISGEGKSFITINLGGIISMLDLKVVILDLDLRKPKLHQSFDDDNTKGISTYLVGQSSMEDILLHTEHDNLQIITSGPIPPNPAELVQSPRMDQLIEELSEIYDYILIDTPPIGLVTDGSTLIKKSDVTLYVIRADYSKRSFAQMPDQLVDEHQFKNLYIVFNSVNAMGRRYGGYGYRVYNYGYYSDDPVQAPWWQFWKRINLMAPFRKLFGK